MSYIDIYVYNIPKKGLHVHLMALYGAVTMYDVQDRCVIHVVNVIYRHIYVYRGQGNCYFSQGCHFYSSSKIKVDSGT
jgi:hypothetical protein